MTRQSECGCDDCCEAARPVLLDGGDEQAVRLLGARLQRSPENQGAGRAGSLGQTRRLRRGHVAATLHGLAHAGHIDRDGQGLVLGAAGLTLADGSHGLAIDGNPFRTWCAFDALAIPAALGADAKVETACGVCGRQIEIDLNEGRPEARTATRLWLSAGGADMRAEFCTPTVLLCSVAHAEAWAERHADHGRALTLAEPAALGAQNWASVAATSSELAQHTTGSPE